MSSTRALANIHCPTCGETTLHRANQCIRCENVSTASGNPPVPRTPRPYGYETVKAKHYDQARAEQSAARRRARLARHQQLQQRGQT